MAIQAIGEMMGEGIVSVGADGMIRATDTKEREGG